MSEFALIAALRPHLAGDAPGIPLGVGDDAAVVEVAGTPVALAVDALVDGIHFDRGISSWGDVGWKALAANVSDLAAIGARATAAVVWLGRPEAVSDAEVVELYTGMGEAARRWGVALVGGDVTGAPALAVSVTVVGELLPGGPLRRDAARPGDAVVVVGSLGEAAAGLALARAGAGDLLDAHPELLAAHRRPAALPEAGAALAAGGAHACIDVSDGLGRDLAHIADDSRVGIRLDGVPVSAAVAAAADRLGVDPTAFVVGGGDDLALAATLPPARLDDLPVAWTRVGEVVDGSGVTLDGRDVSGLGWEHGRR